MVILLSFCHISFGPKYSSADTFDVTAYGAIGDGDTDDTDAFVRAWADVCGDNSGDPTLVIPPDRTFLLKCVAFSGPCNSDSILIQLLGGITAPKSLDGWQGCDTAKGSLISFASVQGLTIAGPGQIDGQGSLWWPGSEGNYTLTGPTCDCPSMLHFHKCDGLQLRDTTYINSPRSHISINVCDGVEVGNVHISAPENSPNTDGFDISESSNINIYDSVIESGDDCFAINTGTHNINITGVLCGPGHGISIGSLGKNGGYATVEQVLVQNCNLTGTKNGVRIKTFPGGTGYARGIIFQDIQLDNVKNPIIIDQHYCDNMENAECPAPGVLMVIMLCFCYISFLQKVTSAASFDVTSYGAIGDGNTDDTNAFVRAWADMCGDESKDPTLIVPSAKTFLIKCVSFDGPCKSPRVHVKLLGNITAPKRLDGWEGCETKGYLIVFASVHGLTITGPGQIDGQGSIWWGGLQPTGPTCDCPSMLRFDRCDNLQLKGTTHINSPKSHVSIFGCHGVEVGNLHISAPGNSPNTDGIDISWSSHVHIHDSTIQSGDDCVAISGGTYDINVTRVVCGPGHGISIGSLGKNGGYTTVEQVLVQHCNITGTQNGLRIKTVPYGTGFARKIVFQDIMLENVGNPIIIDQHYCTNMDNADCPAPPTAPAVQVSEVTYKNVHGSSTSNQAITLNCSGKFNCTGVVTNKVRITGEQVFSYCKNVHGKFIQTTPSITCD
uniref:probable polygalacturonase At3g15720 n=1 Tax=Erigeron canadensis TaxID=72917 RepID=UPI001CB999BB|nr:probable polygalacturonase At3g15720 [Erigeron canadensis]